MEEIDHSGVAIGLSEAEKTDPSEAKIDLLEEVRIDLLEEAIDHSEVVIEEASVEEIEAASEAETEEVSVVEKEAASEEAIEMKEDNSENKLTDHSEEEIEGSVIDHKEDLMTMGKEDSMMIPIEAIDHLGVDSEMMESVAEALFLEEDKEAEVKADSMNNDIHGFHTCNITAEYGHHKSLFNYCNKLNEFMSYNNN